MSSYSERMCKNMAKNAA